MVLPTTHNANRFKVSPQLFTSIHSASGRFVAPSHHGRSILSFGSPCHSEPTNFQCRVPRTALRSPLRSDPTSWRVIVGASPLAVFPGAHMTVKFSLIWPSRWNSTSAS